MKPNTTPDIKQKAANRLRACLDTHLYTGQETRSNKTVSTAKNIF